MSEGVRISNHSGVDECRFRRAAGTLRGHGTLHAILEWLQGRADARDRADLVVQDEFTHDIVLELEPGLVAVYDAT